VSTNNCNAEHVAAERGVCVLLLQWNFTNFSLTVHVK